MGAWIEIVKNSVTPVQSSSSHPSWVRGLKLNLIKLSLSPQTSHPSWVRGLKSYSLESPSKTLIVAPFMGAWIEITFQRHNLAHYNVAPFMGAWIEIPISSSLYWIAFVAPFMGAWIEIVCNGWRLWMLYCRTLHGCVDCNRLQRMAVVDVVLSHSSWVRGLKFLHFHRVDTNYHVAPFMGAWIEILNNGTG